MRTPRHFSRPFPNGLAWALVVGVCTACLNPQPDELPTYDQGNPNGVVDAPAGSMNGAAGSAAFMGGDGSEGNAGGTAGSDGAGVEPPAPDAGAPLDTGGTDAGPAPDAGVRSARGDAGPDGGDAQ